MKRLVTFILLLIGFTAFAQKPTPDQTFRERWYKFSKYLEVDSAIYLPRRDTNWTPVGTSLVVRPSDNQLYYYVGNEWRPINPVIRAPATEYSYPGYYGYRLLPLPQTGNYDDLSRPVGRAAIDLTTVITSYSNPMGARGAASFAVGDRAYAGGGSAIAIGTLAKANNNNSVALGTTASSGGDYSYAIGYSAKVDSGVSSAMAIGRNARVILGNASVAIGSGAVVEANASYRTNVAIGENAEAFGESNVAIGNSTTADGVLSVSIGGNTNGNRAVAVGRNSVANAQNSTAIGAYARSDQYASQSSSLGYQTLTTGSWALAAGATANALNTGAVSVGYNNYSRAPYSTTIGSHLIANSYGSVVMGVLNDSLLSKSNSWSPIHPVLIVGNGHSGERSNAYVLYQNATSVQHNFARYGNFDYKDIEDYNDSTLVPKFYVDSMSNAVYNEEGTNHNISMEFPYTICEVNGSFDPTPVVLIDTVGFINRYTVCKMTNIGSEEVTMNLNNYKVAAGADKTIDPGESVLIKVTRLEDIFVEIVHFE